MKLVIQIPAWNEEEVLPASLAELPRSLPGFDEVEILVIDDGSTDGTSRVAREAGARVVRLPGHLGLARGFTTGIETALQLGADVIVNTDADGQYDPAAIPGLVAPILAGEADIVLGDRGVAHLAHFSRSKRFLQAFGARVVRFLAGVPVRDATTGFRAFSRAAAARLNCFSKFSYTLESLIQAGEAGLTVRSAPVATRPPVRPSRLFRSNLGYMTLQLGTMIRLIFIYRPLRTLSFFGVSFLTAAAALFVRFLYFYVTGPVPTGHTQSLIAGAVLGIIGVQFVVLGILADLTAVNRRLLDELRARERQRK
ncbi:MAG: glycosyltransferase family 2 protein [Acidobacteriota bacterium]